MPVFLSLKFSVCQGGLRAPPDVAFAMWSWPLLFQKKKLFFLHISSSYAKILVETNLQLRKLVITMASSTLQRYLVWRTQSRLYNFYFLRRKKTDFPRSIIKRF